MVEQASDNFDRLIAAAGARLPKSLVDASARTGYSLTGSQPQTPQEVAAEYAAMKGQDSLLRDANPARTALPATGQHSRYADARAVKD